MGGGLAGLMRPVTGLVGGGGLAGLVSNLNDSGLAELLPKVVDQLTPNGEVPDADDVTAALGKLRSLPG